jgi:hypothetical protein
VRLLAPGLFSPAGFIILHGKHAMLFYPSIALFFLLRVRGVDH